MPTLNPGQRFVRIWFTTQLADEAQIDVQRHRRGIGGVLRWQPIAAWRVSRDDH